MTFELQNVSSQGLTASWIDNGVVESFLINSGESHEFEADSLTPETQNLVSLGYLVHARSSSVIPSISLLQSFPMSYRGAYLPNATYEAGSTVLYNGSLWLSLTKQSSLTPQASPYTWKALVNDMGLGNHPFATDNPHNTTAEQVGAVPQESVGQALGVAPLDAAGKVPQSNLPTSVTAASHSQNHDIYLAYGTADEVSAAALRSHVNSTGNPHSTTAAQVGAVALSQVGAANGVAPLDSTGKVPAANLPVTSSSGYGKILTAADNTVRDALVGGLAADDLVAVRAQNEIYRYTGSGFVEVLDRRWLFFVNGKTGVSITLTTNDVAEDNGKYYFTDARLQASSVFSAVSAASHARNADTHLAKDTSNEVSAANLKAHLASTGNPHNVTPSQIGAITGLQDDLNPTLAAALDANGQRLTNLSPPVEGGDAVSLDYLESSVLSSGGFIHVPLVAEGDEVVDGSYYILRQKFSTALSLKEISMAVAESSVAVDNSSGAILRAQFFRIPADVEWTGLGRILVGQVEMVRPYAIGLQLAVEGAGRVGGVSALPYTLEPGEALLVEIQTLGNTFHGLEVTLKLASEAETETSVTFVSDQGTRNEVQRLTANLIRGLSPKWALFGGDNAYGADTALDGGYSVAVQAWDYFQWLVDQGQAIPAVGNHDWNASLGYTAHKLIFEDSPIYGSSQENSAYYKVRLGPFVDLWVLNSGLDNDDILVETDGNTVGSLQYQWFVNSVAGSNATWKVVMFHHPFLTSYASDYAVPAMNWGWRNLGVDMVLNGHSHVAEVFESDSVYVVNASASAHSQRAPSATFYGPPATRRWAYANNGVAGPPVCSQILFRPQNCRLRFYNVTTGQIMTELLLPKQ